MQMLANTVRAVTLAKYPRGSTLTPEERLQRFGYWKNPHGYTNRVRSDLELPPQFSIFGLGFSLFPRTVFEFTLDQDNPLTYVDPDGTEWQPDRHFFNDGPSVPTIVHCIIEPERFLPAGYVHDSGYEDMGLYRKLKGETEFTFVKMSRSEVDELLRLMCGACTLTPQEAWVVWAAVRGGGWVPWYSKGDREKRQEWLRTP